MSPSRISCIVLLELQGGSRAMGFVKEKSEPGVSEPLDSGLYGGTT